MAGTRDILESVYIELDPVREGFAGAFVELARYSDSYVLTETAATTGNVLLRFSSQNPALAYTLFRAHTGPRCTHN